LPGSGKRQRNSKKKKRGNPLSRGLGEKNEKRGKDGFTAKNKRDTAQGKVGGH